MRVEQSKWSKGLGWEPALSGSDEGDTLVLAFGGRSVLRQQDLVAEIRTRFPRALLVGCSTAGEIHGTEVSDDSLVLTAAKFERTAVRSAVVSMEEAKDSFAAGAKLARSLEHDDLVHVFVLSDGLRVNGSELVRGLSSALPDGVSLTGGLSGDGSAFQETLVLCGDRLESNLIVAVGFYGNRIKVGFASLGGWDPFGPERIVTRSKANVLYELDGRSALGLYKEYLGEHAKELPAAGLLFPLSIRAEKEGRGVVRTILAVDEAEQSLTFAGDVPVGSLARLMKANFDRLVDGAIGAAKGSVQGFGDMKPELAVLISCVGRKLILKQRVDDEVEGVREVLGSTPVLSGFYSYGEISPFTPNAKCELHNQTMTITTFVEA